MDILLIGLLCVFLTVDCGCFVLFVITYGFAVVGLLPTTFLCLFTYYAGLFGVCGLTLFCACLFGVFWCVLR